MLKPNKKEVMSLALREVEPNNFKSFQPICKGPCFNALIILSAVIIGFPLALLNLLRK